MSGIVHNRIVILNYEMGVISWIQFPPWTKTTMPDQSIQGVGHHVLGQFLISNFVIHVFLEGGGVIETSHMEVNFLLAGSSFNI